MKSIFIMLVLMTTISSITFGQIPVKQPEGGGSYFVQHNASDEMTSTQRKEIIQMLRSNEYKLKQERKIAPVVTRTASTLFAWPVKQATAFSDNGFYGISNYVDENSTYPNAVLDYNCGNRTYDLSNGYNHPGTDIFTWPFPWQKMQQNAVEIVAAAPGVIIGKTDNNIDTSCAMCSSNSCNWNAVYVRHPDGSVAWYGHMKKNSQTTKTLGEAVVLGEFLGIVGSSGSSTGPHLHFEVYTNSTYTQLIDPWAGACNKHNGNTTWWANQEPYRVSTINKIMTHGAVPIHGCYSQEAVNSQSNFSNSEKVYLGSYYRDQLNGQQSIHTVYRPDNTIFATWIQNFTNTYDASWWYYSIILPNPAPSGSWRYTVAYNNLQTLSTSFVVNTVLPDELTDFRIYKNGSKVTVNFNTNGETSISHYNLLRSVDGLSFKNIAEIIAKNQLVNTYSTIDNSPYKGLNYYKLEIVGKDGLKKYTSVHTVTVNAGGDYMSIIGNPFRNSLRIAISQTLNNIILELINTSGQSVYQKHYKDIEGNVELKLELPSGFYLLIMKRNNPVIDKLTVIKQ